MSDWILRRAAEPDAEGLVALMDDIIAERVFSAIDSSWSMDQQRKYLRELSSRHAVHLAVADGRIVGCQFLEPYSPVLRSMAHVGQVGTFVARTARGRGIASALFAETVRFARAAAYEKFVIQVRASNLAAQAYYTSRGFQPCGRLTRQVRVFGVQDDELIFEYWLP